MPFFKAKFPDCIACKNYRPHTGNVRCLPCGAGEYFEEKVDDIAPDDDELWKMFANMKGGGDYDD